MNLRSSMALPNRISSAALLQTYKVNGPDELDDEVRSVVDIPQAEAAPMTLGGAETVKRRSKKDRRNSRAGSVITGRGDEHTDVIVKAGVFKG